MTYLPLPYFEKCNKKKFMCSCAKERKEKEKENKKKNNNNKKWSKNNKSPCLGDLIKISPSNK
jgi:hypothetical protein